MERVPTRALLWAAGSSGSPARRRKRKDRAGGGPACDWASVYTDVDECVSVLGLCSGGGCTNTAGSTCPRGFARSPDGSRCRGELGPEGAGGTCPNILAALWPLGSSGPRVSVTLCRFWSTVSIPSGFLARYALAFVLCGSRSASPSLPPRPRPPPRPSGSGTPCLLAHSLAILIASLPPDPLTSISVPIYPLVSLAPCLYSSFHAQRLLKSTPSPPTPGV